MQGRSKLLGSLGVAGALAIIALAFLGYEIRRHQIEKASETGRKIFETAMAHYQQSEFEAGLAVIEGHISELMAEPDGCELAISLFAMSNHYDRVIDTAKACLEGGNAKGLAQEAYAFGMSELGQNKEAIAWLVAQDDKVDIYQRAVIALARLYVDEKDWPNARHCFVRAVKDSDIWSVWLSMILKYDKPLVDDAGFVTELAQAIASKPRHFGTLEAGLVKIAKDLKINPELVSQLKEHSEKEDPSAES